jgi:hypothetical protein
MKNATFYQASKTMIDGNCTVVMPVSFDIAINGGAKALGLYLYDSAAAPTPASKFPGCSDNPTIFLGNVVFDIDYVAQTITNPVSCSNIITISSLSVTNATTLGYKHVAFTMTLTRPGTCPNIISANIYSAQANNATAGQTTASCANVFLNNINLPVTWGTLTAVNNGGRLLVNWQTVSEQNVKSFTVEASADGQTWKAIGTVNPQTGGNSTDLLSYSFTSTLPLALGGISIAMLLLSVFVRSKALRIAMVIVVIGFVASCGKDLSGNDLSGKDTAYVRIVQTDNNGGLQYSKIVKVINE